MNQGRSKWKSGGATVSALWNMSPPEYVSPMSPPEYVSPMSPPEYFLNMGVYEAGFPHF